VGILNRPTSRRSVISRDTPVSWAVAVAGILLWQVVASLHWFPSVALPSPLRVAHDIWATTVYGYSGHTLPEDIAASLGRISVGFLAAVAVGVPVGFLMATYRGVFLAIDPWLQFFRPVPPLAYIPVLVIWFGIGELSKVLLIFFCTLPILVLSTMGGVRAIPETRLRLAAVFGLTPWQRFFSIVLPSVLPDIFTGMRVGMGIAWTCLVAAEMIAAQSGLGAMIEIAGGELRTGVVFVGIVFIGLIGYAMEVVLRTIERRVVFWSGKG